MKHIKPFGHHNLRILATAIAAMSVLQSAQAATFVWANSNITATPTASFNWFGTAQGAWTGGAPTSSNANTIQFFQGVTTALTNTGATGNTRTSVIDNGGNAFELGTLTLSGLASPTIGANLTMTVTGDPLNFSAAAGTINLDGLNNTTTTNPASPSRILAYKLNGNIQLGTTGSAGALTLQGAGTGAFNIAGNISELQTGGGSLVKSGASAVTLSGINSYAGASIVNGGTLALSGAGAIANSATVEIRADGILDVSALGSWSLGAGQLLKGNGTLTGTTSTNGPAARLFGRLVATKTP